MARFVTISLPFAAVVLRFSQSAQQMYVRIATAISVIWLMHCANSIAAAGEPISAPASPALSQPTNLASLLAIPIGDLDKVDPGLINILCGEGLPGAEHVNVQTCLADLDFWAKRVKFETDRNYYRFVEHPELFCHSLAYYQMQMLGDVLVNDLGMRYNPVRAQQSRKGLDSPQEVADFFKDSRDIFLFGLLGGDKYGTCASMPFLYVAIGRRLGYPVDLAAAPEHIYVRYEVADGDHLNVEATAVGHFKTPPDEFYRDTVTASNRDDEILQAGWLRPLNNKEIVGFSLESRLACLNSAGRYDEALRLWDVAAKYLPDSKRWRETVQARKEESRDAGSKAHWQQMWRRIDETPIPPGAGYVYFRDQKILLHFLMLSGADLSTTQKRFDDFNQELAKYTVEKDTSQELSLPPVSQPTQYASHFKFPASGKEIVVPADLMPPTMRNGPTEPLINAIFARDLESESAILDFLWDDYEKADLAKQTAIQAKMDNLIADGPQPILIARESVPQEYWNGLPQNLALMLEGETDPRQIIADIDGFHRADEARQARSMQIDPAQQAVQPSSFAQPSPNDDYFAQQRRLQQKIEQETDEQFHPKVPLSQTRIRFVPSSTIQGKRFNESPFYPTSLPNQQSQPFFPNPTIGAQ